MPEPLATPECHQISIWPSSALHSPLFSIPMISHGTLSIEHILMYLSMTTLSPLASTSFPTIAMKSSCFNNHLIRDPVLQLGVLSQFTKSKCCHAQVQSKCSVVNIGKCGKDLGIFDYGSHPQIL